MSRVRDAEYEVIVDSAGEPTGAAMNASGMAAPSDGLAELLSFALNQLGQNNKGRALVEGLNVASLSKDPDRIREVYRRNRAAINELANEIDVRALINQITGAGVVSEEQATASAIGFALGGLAGSALQRYLNECGGS